MARRIHGKEIRYGVRKGVDVRRDVRVADVPRRRSSGGAGDGGGCRAVAELVDNEGERVGTAQVVETAEGVEISVEVQELELGVKDIHIHEAGDTSAPEFEPAGDHFDPNDAEHGLDNPQAPHAGDLENIVVGEDGTAPYNTVNDRGTLSSGERSLLGEEAARS